MNKMGKLETILQVASIEKPIGPNLRIGGGVVRYLDKQGHYWVPIDSFVLGIDSRKIELLCQGKDSYGYLTNDISSKIVMLEKLKFDPSGFRAETFMMGDPMQELVTYSPEKDGENYATRQKALQDAGLWIDV